MSAATAIASYARASSATASPSELVRMAYERVLTACDRATNADLDRPANWVQTFHDEMLRAQAILVELTAGLAIDHEDPSVRAMARELGELYRFAIDGLIEANVGKHSAPLRGVRMVIDRLRDAWVRKAS